MSTRKKLIELYSVLLSNTKIGNAKFKYAIEKNIRIVNSEIDSLKEIEKGIEEVVKEFNDKRNSIITTFGTPDEKGIIFISPDSENFEIVSTEIKELTEEYKEDITSYNEKKKDYLELLEEEIEFDFKLHELNIDNVPNEFEQISLFMDFEIIK